MTKETTTQSADLVKKIFDTAVSMPPGSKIPIEFGSDSQRESFRVRFYNEKRRYAERFGAIEADTISCSKHTKDSKYYLIIERTKPMSVPYVITPDGQIQTIDLDNICAPTEEPEFITPECDPLQDFGSGSETPEQRRLRLMRQEGLLEEENE